MTMCHVNIKGDAMQLDNKALTVFEGGDVEITSLSENFVHRGQIKNAVICGDTLTISLDWLYKRNGSLHRAHIGWTNVRDFTDIVINLKACVIIPAEAGCVWINAFNQLKTFNLYPSGGDKLMPEDVDGLKVV